MKEFEEIKRNLPNQPFSRELVCFIVFGSNVVNNNTNRMPDDIDVCIVVKNRTADLKQISAYIFSKFKKPDFRIYILDEINNNLNFVDVGIGVFAIEYFANGVTLYGENIFIEKQKLINKKKLKDSYLNKIFEYILRIRVAYLSKNVTQEYKMWHIDKYAIRLLIDILLYRGHIIYSDLKNFTKTNIYDLGRKHKIIKKDRKINFDDLENMYELFSEINQNVVRFHSKLS